MTPGSRRAHVQHIQHASDVGPPSLQHVHPVANVELFLDPMMGLPLSIYVDKDVIDRDDIVSLIESHGGIIASGYSGVPYILVDPHKESGQALYRQYAGKKGKLVLKSTWVRECIKAGSLQTFQTNFAGCKVDGSERVILPGDALQHGSTPQTPRRQARQQNNRPAHNLQGHGHPSPHAMNQLPGSVNPMQAMHSHQHSVPPLATPQGSFGYSPYQTQARPSAAHANQIHPAPPHSWQPPNGIVPQQTHLTHPHQPPVIPRAALRDDSWESSFPQSADPSSMVQSGHPANYSDYRYREDEQGWLDTPQDDYYQQYDHGYNQTEAYPNNNTGVSTPQAQTSAAGQHDNTNANVPHNPGSAAERGRKKTRALAAPAAPATTLVANRRNPTVRSPTPPKRIIKSTYGGNLFTADDVIYLKKYIDYCQEQGLVLSLREICERIAVKAPHHTFYSWRRYCNKHQIRLGGYTMELDDRSDDDDGDGSEENPHNGHRRHQPVDLNAVVRPSASAAPGPGVVQAARDRVAAESGMHRDRSPTPPRALFRSTTGKGVAFTDEDVTFLIRFLEYRRSQGRVDMVAFWKDVATKAPHHSRASWMKYWRRHKHEILHTTSDEPLPLPPAKKMRYGRYDDILLAKWLVNKPTMTSDKMFQEFARLHPHHPWKGWQEHHRIHKQKIEYLMQRIQRGENIDEPLEAEAEVS